MTYHSSHYPIVVVANMRDVGDAWVIAEREGIDLGLVLADALHIGMAVQLDKHEALLVARRHTARDVNMAAHDWGSVLLTHAETCLMPAQAWTLDQLQLRRVIREASA